MANENTLAVLEAAINKDPLALKEALNAALMEKVGGVIDAMRSGIFEAEDCDCDDDDDEDEDDKKSDEDDEDEDLDEETVVAVMESILEAAEEEGIELDEEELVELSKETLKSYVDKAHDSKVKAARIRDKGWKKEVIGAPETPEKKAAADKFNKRYAGIETAGRKIRQK